MSQELRQQDREFLARLRIKSDELPSDISDLLQAHIAATEAFRKQQEQNTAKHQARAAERLRKHKLKKQHGNGSLVKLWDVAKLAFLDILLYSLSHALNIYAVHLVNEMFIHTIRRKTMT